MDEESRITVLEGQDWVNERRGGSLVTQAEAGQHLVTQTAASGHTCWQLPFLLVHIFDVALVECWSDELPAARRSCSAAADLASRNLMPCGGEFHCLTSEANTNKSTKQVWQVGICGKGLYPARFMHILRIAGVITIIPNHEKC